MAKSVLQALKGEKATVLVDKLAERLAFERTVGVLRNCYGRNFCLVFSVDGGLY